MSDTSGRTRVGFFPTGRVFSLPALAAAATALTLVAAGCAGGDSSDGSGDGAPKADATYSGVVPAAEAPAPEGFSKAGIQKITINAPEGWQTDKSNGTLCMRPPGESKCGYGSLQVLPKVAKKDPNKWPTKDQAFDKDEGWASAPDTCRSLNTWEDGNVKVKSQKLQPLVENEGLKPGLVYLADGLKANYRAWTVTCENNDTFEVRLWLLPLSDIAVYAWSVDSQYSALYDKVAESMNTKKYKR
ncbi:hypothetical protein CDO52_22710 [Nocardiopsis gilva YIM 90087]|uniref:DUF3558 domain-containing protein n=1 Tax=Nocardiopsis gilva YIM 90087 TaxID=1235441 RepID=A0A223SAQ6_9ACTN|nr:hypothetical protein [Nocardiopsis gilva]ASU85228.1 hypothetical protein CDO52_22710 [Nocardiopsis gilva YIM 90087]